MQMNLTNLLILTYTLERYHDNHPEKNCRYYKLLGVYFDETMSFNYHTNFLCNKLSKSLYCLNRAKNFVSVKALKTLYFALIHSNLNYCSLIFNSTSQKNISKVSKIQKKAIQIVTKSEYRAHTNPLFFAHGILPFDKIVYYSTSLFMHSIEYNYAPKAFLNVWQKNNDRELVYGLRNNNDYVIPLPRVEIFKKSPLYYLPMLWNNLNDNKFQPNPYTFKIAMKNFLLDSLNQDQVPL